MHDNRVPYFLTFLALLLALGLAAAQDDAQRLQSLEAEVDRLGSRVESLEQKNLQHGALLALRYLEAAEFHAMDAALAEDEPDPRFAETVGTTVAVVSALTWSDALQEPVQAFLDAARSLRSALDDGEADAAAEAAALAHDRQHVLAHAIVAQASPQADGAEGAHGHASDEGPASEGTDETLIPEGAERFEIAIGPDGGASGGAATHRVNAGDTVAFLFDSEVAGELHLHGLDGDWKLQADTRSVAVVEATATGRFPMELHPEGGERGVTVAYLEVHP